MSSSMARRRSCSVTHGNSCYGIIDSSCGFVAPQVTHIYAAFDEKALEPSHARVDERPEVSLTARNAD